MGTAWYTSHRGLIARTAIGLLVLLLAIESTFLYQQHRAHEAAEIGSAKLLTTFLQRDTAETSTERGVAIRLQNVRFKWSKDVYIDVGNMAVRAVPIRDSTVIFDRLDSFVLRLQQSVVSIPPQVLQGMFNESVFNYPNSKLRDFKVAIERETGGQQVILRGKVNMVMWVPFTMNTHLDVDRSTNTLVISVAALKVFGLPATKLIKWTPMRLANLVTLPPNNSLMVDGNKIMVKPFGLFPPPRVNGRIQSVSVEPNQIRLVFAGAPIPAPKSEAKNYVYLHGGTAQFANIQLLSTNVLIMDKHPSDLFMFSVQHYSDMIPRSDIDARDTRAIRLSMPDS
jgi:hypothetical protein